MHKEEWLSGRRHHTRNVAWGKPHREFESHLLRGPIVYRLGRKLFKL